MLSPCLIVMDEPYSLVRSDIRVRRVVYVHRPEGSHLSTPESGGCSCFALQPYVIYVYATQVYCRRHDGDIYEYTREEAGETATPSIISHYCQPIYLWTFLSSLERSSRLDDISYLTRTSAYTKYMGESRNSREEIVPSRSTREQCMLRAVVRNTQQERYVVK